MSDKKRYHNANPRRKTCFHCGEAHKTLYRIQHDASGSWDFVCGTCLWEYKRDDNPHYTYGGTWKSRK
ncbi:MAG: hypothetical protein AAF787_23695 [Chloroflexota bacterium]